MRSGPGSRAAPRGDARLALAVLAAAALALGLHASRFWPFLCDDALISLRYVRRLLDGHGLTWNAGERVEGYSNLLWVLATAGLGVLGVDPITAVRVLGVAGLVLSMAAIVCAHPPASIGDVPVVGVPLLCLAASGTYAVWAIGGMEQPLVAALLAWAVVLCSPHLESPRVRVRALQAPACCLALLCLTRPDGPLFTAATVAAVLWIGRGRRPALGRAAALAALPAAAVLGQLLFRLAYYGEWVPNTALVKLHPSARYALDGWRYLGGGALALSPMVLLAAASAAVSLRHGFERARMALLCALAAAWAIYVVVIGGDIFPAWRHFMPLLVLMALMIAIGGEWVRRHARPRAQAAALAGAVALLAALAAVQWGDRQTAWALTERWEWDGQVIGTMLKTAFGARQPLLAVDAAGALPYWSEFPAIDMLGLNDHYLPRHPPSDGRTIGIGHDLGDGQYVLARRPDLVVFGIATGGDRGFFRSAREMQEDPRFAREYALVTFEGTVPYRAAAKVWVRRESERIGIKRAPGTISAPGFLMSDGPGSVARAGAGGTIVAPVSADAPARLDRLAVPAGRWRIEARGTAAALRARITQAGATLLDAPLPAVVDVRDGAEIGLAVAPVAGPAELDTVVLTRLPD